MAVGEDTISRIDAYLSDLFAGWDLYTTLIATGLFIFLIYPLLTWREPDTHPMLLARQATAAPVRQPGESSIFRSLEAPHGYPLRSGLNVKDIGAPKWSSGRDGDLRDIWRQAAQGPVNDDGSSSGPKGKLLTILGREKVLEHELEDVTTEINVIGNYIRISHGKVAAISLSNSVELLAGIFAAAFYGFQAVIVPHGLSSDLLVAHLRKVNADTLIAEAGALELSSVVESCPTLAHVIWVAKHGNRHMGWNEVPEGFGGKIEVSTWHDLVDESKSAASTQVPASEKGSVVQPLVMFWPLNKNDVGEVIELKTENIVSAIAALSSSLPRNQRMTPADLFLPIDSLCFSYPLMLTFSALFSNASVALNSVAGENVDFVLATSNVAPTIIAAGSESVATYHDKLVGPQNGAVAKVGRWSQSRSLAAGSMPKSSGLVTMAKIGSEDASGTQLRLIYVSFRAGSASSTQLPSNTLSDLRIFTGARVVYALTTSKVAGALCQTNLYDYRQSDGMSHFGPPLSSVEVKLSSVRGEDPSDMVGEIFAEGPAVIGGKASLGIQGKFGHDHTLSLV